MTFSIVAADLERGDWGVAVASKFPCVGAVVPYARAGVGAVATQASANPTFGPDGLGLMASGMTAQVALDTVVAKDEGRTERQVAFVDASANAATFTGGECMEWAGGTAGEGFAAQGNILVGETVVSAMAEAFAAGDGDLCDRLLAALVAGDAAGGDRRGKQSAALLVVREGGGFNGRNDRYIDCRVDDHPDAVAELLRVFTAWDETILVRNDLWLPITPDLVREIQRRLRAIGTYAGEETGAYDEATRGALAAWAGDDAGERLSDGDEVSQWLLRLLRDVTPELG